MKKRLRIHDLIFMVMRTCFYQLLIATLCTGLTYATSTEAQEILTKPVSIDVRQQSVDQVLSKIEQAADVIFFYAHQRFPQSKPGSETGAPWKGTGQVTRSITTLLSGRWPANCTQSIT